MGDDLELVADHAGSDVACGGVGELSSSVVSQESGVYTHSSADFSGKKSPGHIKVSAWAKCVSVWGGWGWCCSWILK